MEQGVEARLVDERDVVVETNARFFRIYDHETAANIVNAYDLNTADVAIAIEKCKTYERSGHRVSLAAIVQLGSDRGAVFIIGTAPGAS